MSNQDNSNEQNTRSPERGGLDLDALNHRHANGYDKWFRMCAGAESIITAFENGIVHLDIRVDERLRSPMDVITRNIADTWRWEPELNQATGYCALIYRTEQLLGFSFNPTGMSQDAIAEIIRRFKESPAEPDILIGTIEGTYQKDAGEAPV